MIGQKIKKYLVEKGITQSFVSKKTGIKQTSLNAALNGNRNLTATEYFEICKALELPLDFFVSKAS